MPRGSTSQTTFIGCFSQFVSIYTRSLRYASAALQSSSPIDLATDETVLLQIINLLVEKKDDELAQSVYNVLQEFAVLLIVPPAPFKNSALDQVNFTVNTLLADAEHEATNDAMKAIACVLACQNHEIAMKIFDLKKPELD